jgi:hypothetical protein
MGHNPNMHRVAYHRHFLTSNATLGIDNHDGLEEFSHAIGARYPAFTPPSFEGEPHRALNHFVHAADLSTFKN